MFPSLSPRLHHQREEILKHFWKICENPAANRNTAPAWPHQAIQLSWLPTFFLNCTSTPISGQLMHQILHTKFQRFSKEFSSSFERRPTDRSIILSAPRFSLLTTKTVLSLKYRNILNCSRPNSNFNILLAAVS